MDDPYPVVTDQPVVRQGGEPGELVFRELFACVFHTRAGCAVEPEGGRARRRAVVVAHHRRNRFLADEVDTVGVPGVVADHVPGTDDPVDRRHIVDDSVECDLVPVEIRDDADVHACVKWLHSHKRFRGGSVFVLSLDFLSLLRMKQ